MPIHSFCLFSGIYRKLKLKCTSERIHLDVIIESERERVKESGPHNRWIGQNKREKKMSCLLQHSLFSLDIEAASTILSSINPCHCCHPRHPRRPVRPPGAARPPRRTPRWQCDKRGIDQAFESSGPAATVFSRPYLLKIDPLNLSLETLVLLSYKYSPKTSIVPTSSSLRRQISIVHNEPNEERE